MVYTLVFVGAVLALLLVLSVRATYNKRAVRKFVKNVHTRTEAAKEKGLVLESTEDLLTRPGKQRITAAQMQETRTLVRSAEKASLRGNFEEMERCYIQALTINPSLYEVKAQLAKLYLTTDRASKAEAIYRDVIEHIQDGSCFSNLALACYMQEKFDDACDFYKQALDRDPSNAERQFAFGRSLLAAGKYHDAANHLEKASARLSRDTELLHMLASCYLKLNLNAQAENVYRRINKLEPYNKDVKAKLEALAQA